MNSSPLSEGPWRKLWLDAGSVVDGDTLRLRDDQPERWSSLLGRLRLGPDGSVPVRLVAVDAPESLYPLGPPDLRHQPPAATTLSVALLEAELRRLPAAEVWVQVMGVDRYGRALGLLWPAPPPGLAAGVLDPESVLATLNARLLGAGACYPDFHADLPERCLAVLAEEVRAARAAGRGLWPLDRSAEGVAIDDRHALRERVLVLPRLFRRLAEFWRQMDECDATRQVTSARHQRRAPDTPIEVRFREFLEQREQWVKPLETLEIPASGDGERQISGARPFAEWLSVGHGRCRLEGRVENFLYQNGCASAKTDVAR